MAKRSGVPVIAFRRAVVKAVAAVLSMGLVLSQAALSIPCMSYIVLLAFNQCWPPDCLRETLARRTPNTATHASHVHQMQAAQLIPWLCSWSSADTLYSHAAYQLLAVHC